MLLKGGILDDLHFRGRTKMFGDAFEFTQDLPFLYAIFQNVCLKREEDVFYHHL